MKADSVLQQLVDSLAIPGIMIGCRKIMPGDELELTKEEKAQFSPGAVEKVRRQSGAARIVARRLMVQMGQPQRAILKGSSGAPIWPDSMVGSMAHSAEMAVAALARRTDFLSLGIDIEPAQPLDADLLTLVATLGERQALASDPLAGRLLFTIKEAVYKAVNPLDGVFLEHHDVEADLATGTATVRGGRQVRFRHISAGHIIVLAFV